MTELEKKAEEYARARNCETCYQAHLPPIYCLDVGNHCILCGHDKESFIIGYEQGQKDTMSYKDNYIKDLEGIIDIFKKENKELKKEVSSLRTTGQDEYITCLEEQYEELKERLRIESQSLHEQCEIVSKQVEQIEKMKCCQNCKNKKRNTTCSFCFKLDKWELPE